MSTTFGKQISYTIFGESHGKGIGVVIDGLPGGIALDMEQIAAEMARRAPGQGEWATARKEKDLPEILSGFVDGRTTGTPLMALIRNEDMRSGDYPDLNRFPRPSHGDYSGFIKYQGFGDIRGGGHFSGRITAPLVFAGAVAKQILKKEGISFHAVIRQIGDVRAEGFTEETLKRTDTLSPFFPAFDHEEEMREEIAKAKADGDSVGGMIETVILGLPAGWGDPFFDSFESMLSHAMFAVPAVKGIAFGSGFDLASMRGSGANDAYRTDGRRVYTKTNHNGGITGGITNGQTVCFSAVFKPTPSIAKAQETVDLKTMENTELVIKGRHDPCIVPRAAVVTESVAAMVTLDFWRKGAGNA